MAKAGEFYADLDEETGLYCVFHTESGRAVESYASKGEADERARLLNSAQPF
jgi:hypothetical protein